jgi:hypothetical protein
MSIESDRPSASLRDARRGRVLAAGIAAVGFAAVVLVGCAADGPAGSPLDDASGEAVAGAMTEVPADAPAETSLEDLVAPPDGPLPPEDTEGLTVEPLLAAMYAETGTLLTRGALIERRVRVTTPGSTVYGPRESTVVQRPHLALYLAFTDEDLEDLDRYMDAVVPLTRAFAGAAFERWPDLESFDICLVPASDSDASPEPAIALVDVTREGYERWIADGADLVGLRAFTKDRSSGVRLQFSEPMRELLAARDTSGPA